MRLSFKALMVVFGAFFMMSGCGGGGGDGGGTTNSAPVVTIAPVADVTLPGSASLVGTVTDDGNVLATPTLTWTKESGPGSVSFSSPHAVSTTASFETDGTYVLRLNAYDGGLTGTNTVSVVVNPASSPITVVSGVASLGLISGGTVTVYPVSGGQQGASLGTTTTNSDGTYVVNIGSYTGDIIVEIKGGTYIDEASGTSMNLTDQVPNGLRAAVANASGTVSAAITPLTEIACQRIPTNSINATTIADANLDVATAFGVDNIITTLPVMPFDQPGSGVGTAEKYLKMLAAISKITAANPGYKVSDTLINIFGPAIDSSGNLDSATQTVLNNAQNNLMILFSDRSSAMTGSDVINMYAKGPAYGTQVTFTILTGTARFEGGVTSITKPVVTNGTGDDAAIAPITNSSAGAVTVKATYTSGSTATGSVTFVNQLGSSTLRIYLTAQGYSKFVGGIAKQLYFNVVSSSSSATIDLVSSSGALGGNIEQLNSTKIGIRYYNASGGNLPVSPTEFASLTIGYNPSMPSFTFESVSARDINGTLVPLVSGDFIIQ